MRISTRRPSKIKDTTTVIIINHIWIIYLQKSVMTNPKDQNVQTEWLQQHQTWQSKKSGDTIAGNRNSSSNLERERESNEQQETTWGKPIFKSKSLAIADHQIEQKHAHVKTISTESHVGEGLMHLHWCFLTLANVFAKSQYQSFCDTRAQQICL